MTQAAFDENLNMYTLDTVVVEADKTKNKFGDTITEQSYYRTGGDVKVITKEEIEKRHYADMTDAIKRIPGITFKNPGYRGGEYGSSDYNNGISINGDSRVIVLIDGRRVDNSVSTRFGDNSLSGSQAMVDLNQLVSMNDVEKIEVIKGPGASVYGSDATGGVINIIMKKGGTSDYGSVDVSTGSWNKHLYNVSYSGATGNDKSWKYFLSASRNMSGESKFKDGQTGKTETYRGTQYKDDGVSIRIDKEFNERQNLKVWYNHQDGADGYPIAAPDYTHLTTKEFQYIFDFSHPAYYGALSKPGYRNWYLLDVVRGASTHYKNNDIDITYTFNKDNGMESFIRVYKQNRKYWRTNKWEGVEESTELPLPFTPEWDDYIKEHPLIPWDPSHNSTTAEKNRGIQLQYGKSIGKHDLLGAVTFDRSHLVKKSWNRKKKTWTNTDTSRDSVYGFVQDKIHLSDKWDLTPAIRYSHYSTFSKKVDEGETTVSDSDSTNITPTINTEYAFNDSTSAYFGWTKVYRPIKAGDYSYLTPNGKPLRDEKGNVWTLGLRKDISDKTSVAVHYDWTDMSNVVTYYSVWDTKKEDYATRAVNAKETKKSFNATMEHHFNDKWGVSLAYSHLKDKYEAKDGMIFDQDVPITDLYNINALINALRPQNHYVANFTYECNKWYSGLLVNWYTGCNTTAYTDNRFLVLDWNLNYQVNDKLSTYVSVTNLTNEGYENTYYSWNGKGAYPQPGRAWMVGARYKF